MNAWAHVSSIRTVLALIISFAFHDPRTPSGIERNTGKIPLVFGASLGLRAARLCHLTEAIALFPRPLLGNLRAVTEEELKQLGLTTRAGGCFRPYCHILVVLLMLNLFTCGGHLFTPVLRTHPGQVSTCSPYEWHTSSKTRKRIWKALHGNPPKLPAQTARAIQIGKALAQAITPPRSATRGPFASGHSFSPVIRSAALPLPIGASPSPNMSI